MPTARVFDIHRATTHDGPGLRTTVFFKGCPLACRWCQNPEGISPAPQLQWYSRKCIACYSCQAACDRDAISHDEAGIVVDRVRCDVCGACVGECPARAMTLAGDEYTVDSLAREVLKDRRFFANFGGGVTASGGEPTLQASFVSDLFKTLKAAGVHTALDTSGFTSKSTLDMLLPYTDCVLYDLKFIDDARHVEFTGQYNAAILTNLQSVAEYVRTNRAVDLWIRTPLIPGATATEANVSEIGRFVEDNVLDVLTRWELCAFNSLSREKYEKLGVDWEYGETPLLTRPAADALLAAARKHVPAEAVSVTGILAGGETDAADGADAANGAGEGESVA
jgi:pyruvate formate lyase activating enzyme